MEEIRKAARASYDSFSDEQKSKAYAFFEAMDSDGSGAVSLEEYEEFYGSSNRAAFKDLDTRGNGQLGFEEFKTLFYTVITSAADNKIPVPPLIAETDKMETSKTGPAIISDKKRVIYRKAVVKAVHDFNHAWTFGSAIGTTAAATAAALTLCAIM